MAKEQYSAEEWKLLHEAPFLVGAGVVASDPGGLVGAMQEAMAMGKSFVEAARKYEDVPLIKELSQVRERPASPASLIPSEGSAADRLAKFRDLAVAKSREAIDLVARKADAKTAGAYRGWLLGVADSVANAAKEGSFLGIGGQRVSETEQAFLTKLRGTLGSSAHA
jgi:hypothetical protein